MKHKKKKKTTTKSHIELEGLVNGVRRDPNGMELSPDSYPTSSKSNWIWTHVINNIFTVNSLCV